MSNQGIKFYVAKNMIKYILETSKIDQDINI